MAVGRFMSRRDIIVVGASAGGLGALQTLLGNLPGNIAASIFVVVHIGARPSILPRILASAGHLPVAHAVDGAPIRMGHVHVAPPDRHLMIEQANGGWGRTRLFRGPRENMTRPAVDPLFRSAAEAFGSRVIGVILSGALGDGTAGLIAIKNQGGIAIVQDPDEAQYPGMPKNALKYAAVDHCAPLADISDLLASLSGLGQADSGPQAKEEAVMSDKYDLGRPVALTCPDCGGSVQETVVDSMPYYTCHIGHRYAAPNMDAGQFERMEYALAVALRSLNERVELCRRMVEMSKANGQTYSTERWEEARREAEDRARVLRHFLERDCMTPGTLEDAA
jgi:two-component system, chemotaxis family, protein-glutamate methylesterase/glutaminase